MSVELLPLFDGPSPEPMPPARRRRRLASTSLLAYDRLKPKLPRREQFVVDGLKRHNALAGECLTSGELFAALDKEFPELKLDLNSVRPRLTELSKTRTKDGRIKRAIVERVKQRTCRYRHGTAWTWRVL